MTQPLCWFNSQSALAIYPWSSRRYLPVRAGANSSVFLYVVDGKFPIPGVRIPYYAGFVTPSGWKFRRAERQTRLLPALLDAKPVTHLIKYLSNAQEGSRFAFGSNCDPFQFRRGMNDNKQSVALVI
ncbi:hypothetical protein LPB79_10880 [Rhizobium sp. T136]|uniref:hypothetical protein n=1 Tax=Rhizobium TaxID=379 RepID=UPI00114717B3|nr:MULTISPECIES: hypothetical protein [Rhizobium]UFS82786.1 hypothetical protein LPB79_10880 [Rhizobium sp. T136]